MLKGEGRKALAYCERWVKAPEAMPGPLLMGGTGTFKTHLLWGTAAALTAATEARVKSYGDALYDRASTGMEDGSVKSSADLPQVDDQGRWPFRSVLATDGAEIAHEIRGSVERRNLDAVVAKYRQEGQHPSRAVLLIDDVEVMKLSDWLHEELYRIFNHRYQEGMPTLIVTNLSPGELQAHLGDRIARRIRDLTEPFIL